MDRQKARNYIYYYKWYVLIAVVVIAITVSLVLSIVNKENPDLKVIVAGDTYIADTALLEERIENDIGIEAAVVQNIVLSKNVDAQTEMGMQQKFVIEIAAGHNDVYILDEEQYRRTAELGAIKPIEEVMGNISKLGLMPENLEDLKATIRSDEGEPPNEPKIYGIDVSSSKILRESGLTGERLIVAFGYQGKFTENAVAFVKELLE